MKKIIVLIFSLFVISGCTATYNLDISDIDNISEELIINDNSVSKEEALENYPDLLTDYTIIVDDDDMSTVDEKIPRYDKKIEEVNGVSKISYKYDKFKKSTLKNSTIARGGYNNIGVVSDKEKLQISTNNVLTAFNEHPTLNSLTVNIKTFSKILETNADSVSGNTYTWNFNRNDYNKSILLIVETSNAKDDKEDPIKESEESDILKNKKDENEKTPFWIVLGSVGAFFVVLFLVILSKNK